MSWAFGGLVAILGQLSARNLILGPAHWYLLCFGISKAIYNVCFHPLSRYPAPVYVSVSLLWYISNILTGQLPESVRRLHEKYGPVVRLGPNSLSFADARAWHDIYVQKPPGGGFPEIPKDPAFYGELKVSGERITAASWEDHARMRKKMAPIFSLRSIREQEPLIKGHIDTLISQLKKLSGTVVDMSAWYNFTTFDLIGDLAFGEPFGCLESATYNKWVRLILIYIKVGIGFQAARQFPIVFPIVFWFFFPREAVRERHVHMQLTVDKATRRMRRVTDRKDFMQHLLTPGSISLTEGELISNSATLIVAGSETSATTLAGVSYFLTKDPPRLKKLVDEIRTTFESESEIDITSVAGLPYLKACIEEILRIYPPAPSGMPRRVPPGTSGVQMPGSGFLEA